MNICIIGWYGTETLGDRSILLGLIKIFGDKYDNVKIYLGSINPFFSKRCYIEDKEFLYALAPHAEIEIFDVKDKRNYKKTIKKCDLVAMGGGPIMELLELGIIEFGFGYARRNKVKTALLGVGISGVDSPYYRRIVSNILNLSDLCMFRDEFSKTEAEKLLKEYGIENENLNVSFDPAIIPVGFYIENYSDDNIKKQNSIAINFRKFKHYKKENEAENVFVDFIKQASEKYDSVSLVPMHTFVIGGDDRLYLTKLSHMAGCSNVKVIQKPQSLFELFKTFAEAECCAGMRYHSVFFETFLNGRNMIFDYTPPLKGKISGFLNILSADKEYENLYVNTQQENFAMPDINQLDNKKPTEYDYGIFNKTQRQFTEVITKLLSF